MRVRAIAVFGAALALNAAAQTFEVPRELWDRPRTGRAVLESPNVRAAVGALLDKPESRLVIHHAAGTERLVEAEELRSWLAALAIDAQRVNLRADLATNAPLTLEVSP